MRRPAWVLAILAWASPAEADGARGQGFVFDVHAGAGAAWLGATEPAILYGLGAGVALNQAANVAVGVELDGLASWRQGRRLDRGGFFATGTIWFDEHVSLVLGAGTPVSATALWNSFAGFARVNYEVTRWGHSGLVLGLDLDEDTTVGPQATVLVGLTVFTQEKSINLWNPM